MKKLFLRLSSIALLTSSLFGTVYSDGTNPNDWKYYTTLKGEVSTEDGAISFKGTGTKSGAYIQLSPITKDGDTIKWRMKFKNYFKVYVQVATNKGIRYLVYYPLDNFSKKSGRFFQIGVGRTAKNGKWQTFTRDINKDLRTIEPELKLNEIKAFFVRGTGLVDDVEVTTTDGNGDSSFDFKKFNELLKVIDIDDAGDEDIITIRETTDPRIKIRYVGHFMGGNKVRGVYTLSKDNSSLVELDTYYNPSRSDDVAIKVSADHKKLIIDDGFRMKHYRYKELDITNLPEVREITTSKKPLYDMVHKIVDSKDNSIWASLVENRDDIVIVDEMFRKPNIKQQITFYMLSKSGDKANIILQTEKVNGHNYVGYTKLNKNSIVTMEVGDSIVKRYDISKCLKNPVEGCAQSL